MEKLNSLTELFKNIEGGDELTIETEYGHLHNRKVINDTDPRVETSPKERRFVFGDYELCEYLVIGYQGPEIKSIESDGSLEVNGDTALTIVNQTQNEWAGRNEDLIK